MMDAGIGYAVYVFSDANGLSVEGNVGFPQTLQAIGSSTGQSFEFPLTYTDHASDAMIGMDNCDAYALASMGENSIHIVSPMDGVMWSRQAVPSDFEDILHIPLGVVRPSSNIVFT